MKGDEMRTPAEMRQRTWMELRRERDEALQKLSALQEAAESVLGQRRLLVTRSNPGSYLPDNPVVRGKLDHLARALDSSREEQS